MAAVPETRALNPQMEKLVGRWNAANPPREALWTAPVLLGSLFGVGLSPILRGTCGSLVAALAAWGLTLVIADPAPLWWALAVATALASWIAGRGVLASLPGTKDPGWFVLDEVAGIFLVLALIGAIGLLDICFAFLAFRVYDMAKPWPLKTFEQMPGSPGILADDLAAAVLAAGTCWWLAPFRPLWFG